MFYNEKDLDIICPSCKRVVIKADKRDYHTNYIKCSKCNKLVVYTPCTREVRNAKIPARQSSSGKRFY